MAHRILIVDDDQIFNNLLTDVFKQAGYEVRSAHSADEALPLLDREAFDLVVTDQRMPGKLGTEFVREVMAAQREIPIVMVSGFLENETIRELIRDGVGGVFIKPLNIFQLLKRAAQLIERKEHPREAPQAAAAAKPEPGAVSTGSIRSFPGRSPRAIQFARRLQELREFTSNLLLAGRRGTDFETVCRDLHQLSQAKDELVFYGGATDPANLAGRLHSAEARGADRSTIVIGEPEKLSHEQLDRVFALSRRQPPFNELRMPTRFVFCLREDLDTLYDSGHIDENLYLFMGTNELKVPAVAEVRDDVPVMAQTILDQSESANWRLDTQAGAFLREQEWPGDMLQLAKVMHEASAMCPGSIIGLREVSDAYAGKISQRSHESGNLRDALESARDQYVRAVITLCGDDRRRAAVTLGVPEGALEEFASA